MHTIEAKKAFQMMAETDPAQHREVVSSLVRSDGNGYKRDWKKFKSLISEYGRIKQLSSEDTWKEMNYADFFSYWEGRNRTEPNIKLRWAKATTNKMFKKKMAWLKGKETWVWQKLQKELKRKDIVEKSLRYKSDVVMDKDSMQQAMTSDSGVNLPSFGKSIFGGLLTTLSYSSTVLLYNSNTNQSITRLSLSPLIEG